MRIVNTRIQNLRVVGQSSGAVATDEYFNLVTLLLPGNGTNGAQNNTFLDSSTNALTVTRNGNPTQGTFSPFSQTGWSNYFDGSGDTLQITPSSPLDFGTGDFTVELWALFDDISVDRAFIGSGATGGYDFVWRTSTGLNIGRINVAFDNTFAWTPTVGVWYHIVYCRSGTSLRVFVNGTQIGSTATNSISYNSATTFIVGGSTTGERLFLGYLSNMRLIKGTALYTSNFTPPTAPLTAVSGTSLLTCQSNRFIDNSTNAFAITVNGNTAVQAFAPFDPTAAYSAGTVGGSAYFDGSGDYLQNTSITNQFDVDSGFTLEFWTYSSFYPESSGYINVGGSTVNWNATTGLYWSLFRDGSNLQWQTNLLNGLAVNVIATTAPPTNTWTHIAIGYNGTTTRMWVNGTSVGTSTQSYGKPSGTDRIQVGAFTGGAAPYFGYFSEIRFVKGTDVYGVGNTSITVPTAPLTAISGTSLLLSGTNGGITDAAAKNVFETVDGAQISTAQSKFGGSAMLFDGTGDWLLTRTSPNLDMGTGDLTIEGWFYLTTTPADYQMIVSDATNGYNYVTIRGGGTGGQIEVNINGGSFRFNLNNSVSANTWFHLAVTRSTNTWYGFINGTSVGSTTNSNIFNLGNGGMYVGRFGGGTAYAWPGYMDDLRITKGYARYTANFTPPTTAFPTQ